MSSVLGQTDDSWPMLVEQASSLREFESRWTKSLSASFQLIAERSRCCFVVATVVLKSGLSHYEEIDLCTTVQRMNILGRREIKTQTRSLAGNGGVPWPQLESGVVKIIQGMQGDRWRWKHCRNPSALAVPVNATADALQTTQDHVRFVILNKSVCLQRKKNKSTGPMSHLPLCLVANQ